MKKIILFILPGILLAGPMVAQRKFVDDKPFIYTPRTGNVQTVTAHSPNRSYNGTNNNIGATKKEWGATDVILFRELAAQYDAPDTKNSMNGTTRPSAREISNLVCDEPVTHFNERNLSAFCYVWGQFLDHDITLTPGSLIEPCPILLPANEPLFTLPIGLSRSDVKAGTGVTNNREQYNINTAWIDGSQVYGSDSIRANWLRSHVNGKMKVSVGNFLPYNTLTGEAAGALDPSAPSMGNDVDHTVKVFVAGDVRASEHPGILGLHTVFVREHNRICNRLLSEGWTNDELIYQRARKEVGAMIQVITFEQFLPAIGVVLSPYNNYNSNVRPDIMNTFATAGYRIGHTMVADDILLRDNNCLPVGPDEIDLVDAFFNMQLFIDNSLDAFLKGFATHTQYETDTRVNSVLRNFLFGDPNAPVRFGLDLASINIQRGRDHGLPSYKTVRAFYTGVTITSFSQITSNTALAADLQTLYGNVNNIDLWIGLLAEDLVLNKSVGATMHAMLKSQFEKLRDGDYYFYKFDPFLPSNIRNQIRHTSFADVLERNTGLINLQDNVFFAEICPGDDLDENRIALSPGYSGVNLVNVHPNPSSGDMFVDFGNTDEPCTMNLYSTDGALIRTIQTVPGEKSILISLANLKNGLYVLNVWQGNDMQNIRIVKAE